MLRKALQCPFKQTNILTMPNLPANLSLDFRGFCKWVFIKLNAENQIAVRNEAEKQ